jgi:serine palmitoyltransferase
VQNGLHLSRSIVVYFKHNDVASLARTLEKLTRGNKRAEKIRRYIVVESIYKIISVFWFDLEYTYV